MYVHQIWEPTVCTSFFMNEVFSKQINKILETGEYRVDGFWLGVQF